MTAEIAVVLSRAGIGQSTVIGIGGDKIIGSDFEDILSLFENDGDTDAVVMFGEVGGVYEEKAAEFIARSGFKKPVVAIIAGKFTNELPLGTVLGHAGAIVEKGRGSYDSKIKALKRVGVRIAKTLEDIPKLLKQ
jgi:succinyl-CoA synthetase alpha subunit